MIKYTLDSTLTLRASNYFKNQGIRENEKYDRKNSSENGFSLTPRSKRKIKQMISGYFLERELNNSNLLWITLTVPPHIWGYDYKPEVDDKRIIKQLSKFLENLRKRHGLNDYLWVAERQDGKRNDYEHYTDAIHFHCVFDFSEFVPVQNLNLYWLSLLNQIGFKAFSKKVYVEKSDELFSWEKAFDRNKLQFDHSTFEVVYNDRIQKEKLFSIIKSEIDQCQQAIERQKFADFFKGFSPMLLNPDHPLCKICYNPLDLDKVSIKEFTAKNGHHYTAFERLSMYLTKYISKNESVIYGRPWGASRGFSSVNYEISLTEKEADQVINSDQVIFKSESSFHIGEMEYTTQFFQLGYENFKDTPLFNKLIDNIMIQRMNNLEDGYELIRNKPLSVQFDIISQLKDIKPKSPRTNSKKLDFINPILGISPNMNFLNESELEEILRNEKADQMRLFEVPVKHDLHEKIKNRSRKGYEKMPDYFEIFGLK